LADWLAFYKHDWAGIRLNEYPPVKSPKKDGAIDE
jgi:hypothetical protein